MSNETGRLLIEPAKSVDVLADDLKRLIDAAAESDLLALIAVKFVLNNRGVKRHLLNSYADSRLRLHLLDEDDPRRQAARKALKELTEEYDCLK